MLGGVKSGSGDNERGAAIVEFVLVCLVLLPLFTMILQVGIYLHVRNTARACAHEGARFGANYNREAPDGGDEATRCLQGSLERTALSANGHQDGETVVVELHYRQPQLGVWGEAWDAHAVGHARKEPDVN